MTKEFIEDELGHIISGNYSEDNYRYINEIMETYKGTLIRKDSHAKTQRKELSRRLYRYIRKTFQRLHDKQVNNRDIMNELNAEYDIKIMCRIA